MTWKESHQALITKTDVQNELIQNIFKFKYKTFKFKYFNKTGNAGYTKNHP